MNARWSYFWALLFVILHIYAVAAEPIQVLGREDTSLTVTVPPTTTTDNAGKDGQTSSERTDATGSTQKPTADKTSTIVATSTTAFPSAINGNNPDNISPLATPNPIPDGELPLQPRLTPGWGIAGAILLISGVIYTLIGIKNVWLHTFFSAAFLSGLSVTVLIVYVMAPPVPVAIEGAYVVAAVVTGLILGGVATVFHELTEGLGCLLGGFCISMWLLTLKPGGLLPSTTSKVIVIAAFSAGSYGFYFSRYTRPYALLGLMSFAGATVTVIGIDCFSRAGLKEFWAYSWNLNKGLFPYAADTYPLTKGIRVEIAIIVVLTIVGVISQLKLWRVIQEHRTKKAEAQAEEQRKRDEEEANIGLQVEAQNERERRQWETVYGNQQPRSSIGSRDSGVEDVDDDKKDRVKQTVVRRSSSNEDNIELSEISTPDLPSSTNAAKSPTDGLIMTNQNDDSRVTIRIAEDDGPNENDDTASTTEPNEKKVWIVHGDDEARLNSPHTSQIPLKPPGPEITPLPFRVPEISDGNHSRSSIATYADEDDGDYMLNGKPSRMSLTNRLSASSGNLIHNLSHRSTHARTSRHKSRDSGLQQSLDWERSTEELVENSKRHSDVLSIAATIDGLSLEGDAYDYSTKNEAERMSIPAVKVNLDGGKININTNAVDKGDSDKKLTPPNAHWSFEARPMSSAETVGTDILNPSVVNLSSGELSKRSSLNQSTRKTESTNENSNPTDMNAVEATSESSPPPKSLAPSTSSTSVSLTKDRLPPALPRVALSYRTNEWAKHLSAAESPPLEELQVDEYPDQQHDRTQETEAPAPVRVEELQQTSEGYAPTEVIIRSSSSSSNLASRAYHSTSRIASSSSLPKAHIPATLAILTSASFDADPQVSPAKTTSSNLPQAGHSFRNKGRRRSSEVYNQPIREEIGNEEPSVERPGPPDEEDSSTPTSTPPSPHEPVPIPGVVSYSSPQTLLGRREMYLRNKSQSQLFTIPPIQEDPNHTRPASQMVSPYNHVAAAMPPLTTQDADDIPLSQRKHLIRQSSALSVNSTGGPQRTGSWSAAQPPMSDPPTHIQTITADSSRFDSHQPQRRVSGPSQAERDARLSQFRQSVAADLRAAAAPVAPKSTPLLRTTSSTSLLGPSTSNAEIGRAIDLQRNMLMTQREQEGQKREMERLEKERHERAFEEMMRRGDLMDAHREALRRMQGGVKHE
ncbi:hypothetical protein FHL15_007918 [Xylaria flabelliformis]|uniref:TM7S3/TM198-like domain-containing protein n=1 Tax=Xylaria flabelliformis TaxID=2512241 RepID=A0A553HT49_9PEZI|nr:hypothetical protein FHL15_007918 [Xylaria flabelliformis]